MPNLAAHLFRQAVGRGDKVALRFGEAEYSFRCLAEAVSKAAHALRRAGVEPGARAGLLIPSSPEFIIFEQALFALGATVCPIDSLFRPDEVAYAVASRGLQYLLVAPELQGSVPPDLESATDMCGVLLTRDDAETQGFLALDRLAADAPCAFDLIERPAESIGLMLSTSATTGKAKGVQLSIANLQANYDRTPDWLGLTAADVILCALPLYNTFGLNQGINALFATGASMVLLPRFDVELCLAAIETHGCTFIPAVPTMLQRLLDHPSSAQYELSSVARIMTGAAPVPGVMLERVHAAMGVDTAVLTGYGLTEATALVTLERVEFNAQGELKRPKSIGRVLPGMELQAVRPDGSIAAAHEVGEFRVRGPNVMVGYFRRPEETAVALQDGWLHTGDLGVIDEDGYAYIVDRKKDVIIRGGQNIYPADIEEVLYSVAGVAEVAVVGRADEEFGEVPVAFVALVQDATVKAADLLDHCRTHLARYKTPVAVHLLPELPKGPTGKILRRDLRSTASTTEAA